MSDPTEEQKLLWDTVEKLAGLFDIQDRLESGNYWGLGHADKIRALGVPILQKSNGVEYVRLLNTDVFLTDVELLELVLIPIESCPYKGLE